MCFPRVNYTKQSDKLACKHGWPRVWTFILSGYLPTVVECVQAICVVSSTYGSAKQVQVIHDFRLLLKESWEKAFGPENVAVRKMITKRLTQLVKDYTTEVLKRKGKRTVNLKKWSKDNNKVLILFHKEVEVDKLPEAERLYYEEQVSLRRNRFVTGEPDKKYVIEQGNRLEEILIQMENEHRELQCSFGDEITHNDSANTTTDDIGMDLSFSSNRSSKSHKTAVVSHAETQTEFRYDLQLPLQDGLRNFNNSIKLALASSCLRRTYRRTNQD